MKELNLILTENEKLGLRYLSDQDARSQGSASPYAHLWDNGKDAVEELKRIGLVRAAALGRFGLDNIPEGSSLSTLEDVLVPLFLAHRYQVEAAATLIGGVDYAYSVKELNKASTTVVPVFGPTQEAALAALLKTIDPAYLKIPDHILDLIPPRTMGDRRGREQFKNRTAPTFDPLGAAEAAAAHTINLILNPQRLSRLVEQNGRHATTFSVQNYLQKISNQIRQGLQGDGLEVSIGQVVQYVFVLQLMHLAVDRSSRHQVRGAAIQELNQIAGDMLSSDSHSKALAFEIKQFIKDPNTYIIPKRLTLPDGSPIGCSGH